jgi:hypothetical protein
MREEWAGEGRKREGRRKSGKLEGVVMRGTIFKGEGARKFSCFEGS